MARWWQLAGQVAVVCATKLGSAAFRGAGVGAYTVAASVVGRRPLAFVAHPCGLAAMGTDGLEAVGFF